MNKSNDRPVVTDEKELLTPPKNETTKSSKSLRIILACLRQMPSGGPLFSFFSLDVSRFFAPTRQTIPIQQGLRIVTLISREACFRA
jgi:hypothetical protein